MTGPSEIRLKDGRTVLMRDAGPQDTPAIEQLLATLSPGSFRNRFQCERVGPAMVRRLAQTDRVPSTRSVIVTAAGEPGLFIAEARYVPTADRTAEIALTIADEYQHAGLGRTLVDALAERAAAAGVERLQAVVNLDNAPMLRLLGSRPWVLAEATDEYRMATLEISATGGMPGWPPAGGQRILIERRGWFDDRRTAALRAAGHSIRQCTGPDERAGRPCPLVVIGHCRLAAEADQIVCLLPGDDITGGVATAHRATWPHKLVD